MLNADLAPSATTEKIALKELGIGDDIDTST
jgi:hypothetical protein